MLDFAATATRKDKLPEWATRTYEEEIVLTEAHARFTEIPEDVQSIKLEEGRV